MHDATLLHTSVHPLAALVLGPISESGDIYTIPDINKRDLDVKFVTQTDFAFSIN